MLLPLINFPIDNRLIKSGIHRAGLREAIPVRVLLLTNAKNNSPVVSYLHSIVSDCL